MAEQGYTLIIYQLEVSAVKFRKEFRHRRIWWGDRGGGCPPWNSRLTLIRAKKEGLLGQQTF